MYSVELFGIPRGLCYDWSFMSLPWKYHDVFLELGMLCMAGH